MFPYQTPPSGCRKMHSTRWPEHIRSQPGGPEGKHGFFGSQAHESHSSSPHIFMEKRYISSSMRNHHSSRSDPRTQRNLTFGELHGSGSTVGTGAVTASALILEDAETQGLHNELPSSKIGRQGEELNEISPET